MGWCRFPFFFSANYIILFILYYLHYLYYRFLMNRVYSIFQHSWTPIFAKIGKNYSIIPYTMILLYHYTTIQLYHHTLYRKKNKKGKGTQFSPLPHQVGERGAIIAAKRKKGYLIRYDASNRRAELYVQNHGKENHSRDTMWPYLFVCPGYLVP